LRDNDAEQWDGCGWGTTYTHPKCDAGESNDLDARDPQAGARPASRPVQR